MLENTSADPIHLLFSSGPVSKESVGFCETQTYLLCMTPPQQLAALLPACLLCSEPPAATGEAPTATGPSAVFGGAVASSALAGRGPRISARLSKLPAEPARHWEAAKAFPTCSTRILFGPRIYICFVYRIPFETGLEKTLIRSTL